MPVSEQALFQVRAIARPFRCAAAFCFKGAGSHQKRGVKDSNWMTVLFSGRLTRGGRTS